MKRVLFLMLAALALVQGYAQRDKVILRDGTVRECKLEMVTTDSTVFTADGRRVSIHNTEVYMVKYDKRGNVFYTDDGEQFSGEGDGKVPGAAAAIYLAQGKEIVAYNLMMGVDQVTYQTGKKKNSPTETVAKDDIFMICYHDGTRTIVNDFGSVQERKRAREEAARRKAEEERLAALRAQYPKDGTLLTVTGKRLNVTVVSEDDTEYMFKRRDIQNSPVFQISKTYVTDLNLM